MTEAARTLSDAELELHIVDCGKQFLKAHSNGDEEGMRHWLNTEVEAVRQRSPEQVARMERALGLDCGCYFERMGAEARSAAQSGGQAS